MELIEDGNESQSIELSNVSDWFKFNGSSESIDNDPFKISGDDLKKRPSSRC